MAQYYINNQQEPIHFEIGDDPVARTLQNAKNLLMTRLCEVPYNRFRGLNPALQDLPFQKMREALLPELDRLMMWEPDVEVVDAECTLDDQGGVLIVVTLEIDIDE